VSVIGTGDIHVHDPKALLAARLEQTRQYAFSPDDKIRFSAPSGFHLPPLPGVLWGHPPGAGRPREAQRPQACVGCHSGCRARFKSGLGNGAICFTTLFYGSADSTDIQRRASDLLNRYGLNAHEMIYCDRYLTALNDLGVLGPGKAIDCPLDFNDRGSLAFVTRLVRMIACRNDGNGRPHDFGRRWRRASSARPKNGAPGRGPETGLLPFPFWGLPVHKEPSAQLEWGYGTLLGDRNINEHDFDWIKLTCHRAGVRQKTARSGGSAGQDHHRQDGTFSGRRTDARLQHGQYVLQAHGQAGQLAPLLYPLLEAIRPFLRLALADFVNENAPGKIGSTGIAEPKFLNAVTGKTMTFLDGIELGRRIWNLDHAIWTLQGRHRRLVHFADYAYKVSSNAEGLRRIYLPGMENDHWTYLDVRGRTFDRRKVEEFKTCFYKVQGWDVASGYPTRRTLTSLGLGYVADELEKAGRLGAEAS
jgi:aldehyde:ferredoxin oxidoreductase